MALASSRAATLVALVLSVTACAPARLHPRGLVATGGMDARPRHTFAPAIVARRGYPVTAGLIVPAFLVPAVAGTVVAFPFALTQHHHFEEVIGLGILVAEIVMAPVVLPAAAPFALIGYLIDELAGNRTPTPPAPNEPARDPQR